MFASQQFKTYNKYTANHLINAVNNDSDLCWEYPQLVGGNIEQSQPVTFPDALQYRGKQDDINHS